MSENKNIEFIDYRNIEKKIYKSILEHPEAKDALLDKRSEAFKHVMVTPEGDFIQRIDVLEAFSMENETDIPTLVVCRRIAEYVNNAEAITSDIFQG